MNLNQITLPVSDMDADTAFYRRLGFPQIVDTPHYARFECPEGGATFSLSLTEGSFENGAVVYFESGRLGRRARRTRHRIRPAAHGHALPVARGRPARSFGQQDQALSRRGQPAPSSVARGDRR